MLVWNKAGFIIISLKINLFSPCYSWKFVELALNNHSLTQIIMLYPPKKEDLNEYLFHKFSVNFKLSEPSLKNYRFSVNWQTILKLVCKRTFIPVCKISG